MTYLFLLVALTGNALANICIKLGSQQFAEGVQLFWKDPAILFKNGFFLAGVMLFAVALVMYSLGISKMNLSIAYPIMTSMGFLIVVSFSVWQLQEQLMWWQWMGIVLILLGVILLSQGMSTS